MTRTVLVLAVISLFVKVSLAQQRISARPLYGRDNLIAWCIVPFDSKERNAEERAVMLDRLGIHMLAYDWREKHIPYFDAEIDALEKHGITLQAFWYYSGPDPEADSTLKTIFALFARRKVKTQLWCMITGIPGIDTMTERQKIMAHAKPLKYIAEQAALVDCTVGFYNHGGWAGDPVNQLAVMDYLKMPNIGIVYNFHHAENDLDRFTDFLPKIKPYLLAVNLMGLKRGNPVTVVPIGQGDAEAGMMALVSASGYSGPIGIINEETAPDAEEGLKINMSGLKQILARQHDQAALRTFK